MTPPFEVTTVTLLFVLFSRFASSTEVAMVRPLVTALWRYALETMSLSSTGADLPWASPRRRRRWSWGCSWTESWLRVQRCSDSPVARNTRYILMSLIYWLYRLMSLIYLYCLYRLMSLIYIYCLYRLFVGSWHGHFGYDIIFLKYKREFTFIFEFFCLRKYWI